MQYAEQHWSKLIHLICALALVLSLLLLGWTLFRLIGNLLSPAETALATNPQGTNTLTQLGAGQDPAKLPLFGRRQQAVAMPIGATETKLDYQLRGTIPGVDPQQGMAIIEVNGRQRSYRVGDPIDEQQDISLYEVHADHIVIARPGRNETLPLSKAASAGTNQPVRPRQSAAANNLPGTTPVFDNTALIQSIKALPHFEQGQQKGFRIQVAPQHANLMRNLGLRSTDVITAVNGVTLNDPTKAMELARQLKNAPQVEVQLRRDGAEQTLTIDTNKIRN